MTRDLDEIFGQRDLRASPLIAVQAVMAVRLSLLYTRAGRDPAPDMAVRLRSMRAARALQDMVATIGAVWPESFLARRPCCMILSADEALLADVATATVRGDRTEALDAMRDFLPRPSRQRLFGDMIELVDAVRTAQATSAGARSAND